MRSRRHWLLAPVVALASLGCSAGSDPSVDASRTDATNTDAPATDGMVERCGTGVDSDNDGVPNDAECTAGSDPFNPDSDGDGVRDGNELRYPRICVAEDRAMQRRPPAACTDDAGCMPGERCRGLDPTSNDSDGDGVPDNQEEMGLDGMIDVSMGETDPRLWDTDGDGVNDAMGGLDICRPAGLATVTQVDVPPGATQVGHDPAWGTARTVTGTSNRGAVVLDDTTAGVAGAVFLLPSSGSDLRAEQMRIETEIQSAIGGGVTPVLVGRMFTTHEMHPAIASTYRIARAGTASMLRDALVMPLTGAAAPAGGIAGAGSEFLLDVTTVLRGPGPTMGRTDVIVTIAPRSDYEDATRPTSIRSNDLANATAVAESGKQLGHTCQVFRAERTAIADFIWTVDTSGSMGRYQMSVGNVATQFFQRLQAAGVDFRVGVFQAGSATTGPDLESPGFRWISGSDPEGPRRLCEDVTSTSLGRCPTSPSDSSSPYPFRGGSEEPTAAAVLTHHTFAQRGRMGESNPDRRFREGARVVTFHVTDEPGSNDFGRYFARNSDPETGMPWGTTYNAATIDNIVGYFRRNMILTFGLVPVRATTCSSFQVYDLPRCVIEGNGGAVIPIATATDPEIAAAMARIVDAVAGATSQFRLNRSPITSTIKVRVRGMDVPRSRSQGFDYDPASRSIVFYGSMYRPMMGDEVVISYRIWEGSLG